MTAWKANPPETLAVALAGLLLAGLLHRRIAFLDRWHIPKPVTGGLLFACAVTALRTGGFEAEFDTVARDLFMLAFFTTIGLRASTALLRRQGGMVAMCLGLGLIGAVIQNLVGVAGAKALGLHPLVGVIAGATTLAGGPATALAFGETFERMGIADARTLGIACAVFGILAAGLVGGAIGGVLIQRYGLKGPVAIPGSGVGAVRSGQVWFTLGSIAICLGLGSLLSRGIQTMGILLPPYIGAMIVAGLLRFRDDRGARRLDDAVLAEAANWSLALFIVIALLTLKLWVLTELALPLLAILAAQVAVTSLFALLVTYRSLGGDYDAAVAAAGWTGFMLGTTANAVACMDAIESRHGAAPRARMAIPVTGGFLIDFTNSFVILYSADLVRRLLIP